jgi:uncharacterized protein (DUF1697 family)
MNHYVTLLRGINVGGRVIKMTDLKSVYQQVGVKDVKTFLQSGNVTFSSNSNDPISLRSQLEQAVSTKFNYDAKIFVLRREQLKYAYKNYPFVNSDEQYQNYVIFMESNLANKLYELGKTLKPDIDKLALGKDVVYWQVEKGMTITSPFSKLLVKPEFREFHTNRNIKTIAKLLS